MAWIGLNPDYLTWPFRTLSDRSGLPPVRLGLFILLKNYSAQDAGNPVWVTQQLPTLDARV